MLLTMVRVEGMRSTAVAEVSDMGAVCALPPVQAPAIADGLTLLHAALTPMRATAALRALGVGRDDTNFSELDGRLDEVEQLDPHGVSDLVADAPNRAVTIHVDIRPDPPMFGALRDVAARDPRLVAALATGADLHLRVGWLFNRAGTHASVGILAFHVGEERFPTAGGDRAGWLPDVLHAIGSKIMRAQGDTSERTLANDLLDATLSPSPAARAAVAHARQALGQEPFELGTLELVRRPGGQVRIGVGPDLLPLRTFGPAGLEAVRVVHAALVSQPDVLIMDVPRHARWQTWLGERTQGQGATLEQLLWVPGP